MFGDALSTPAKTSDSAVTLFIGGVLTLLAVLGPLAAVAALSVSPLALVLLPLALLPILVLRGYYVAVTAGGANRDPGAPSIVRWGKLVSDGVKSVLVSLGYLLPAVLLVALVLGALVALVPPEVADPGTSPAAVESSTSDARALGVLAVTVLGSLLLIGYALLYAYVRPAALAVFAVSGSLRDAFRLGRVRSVAGTGDYAVGWLLAGLVLVVGGLFALPLSVLLVGFFLLFYVQVVAHSLYGRAASDVLVPGAGPVGETSTEEYDGDDGRTSTDDDDDVEPGAPAEDAGTSADDAGFPSEWAAAAESTDDSGGSDSDPADGGAPDSTASDDATDADTSASGAEALTDWDAVTDAVESTPGDDRSPEPAGGGVSAAVQSGRGVPLDEADRRDAPDEEADDADSGTGAPDGEADDADSGTGAPDGEADDPFDWGPTDDR